MTHSAIPLTTCCVAIPNTRGEACRVVPTSAASKLSLGSCDTTACILDRLMTPIHRYGSFCVGNKDVSVKICVVNLAILWLLFHACFLLDILYLNLWFRR